MEELEEGTFGLACFSSLLPRFVEKRKKTSRLLFCLGVLKFENGWGLPRYKGGNVKHVCNSWEELGE